MRIEPLGDLAWILRDLDASPATVARSIEASALAGVTDVVPCAETVGVFTTGGVRSDQLSAAAGRVGHGAEVPQVHVIPVCYDLGADIEMVCSHLGITRDELIDLHSNSDFSCFAIGFCPGFAYLGPLPHPLVGVPRLPSPRVRTEPGSVAITGNQTAVYPLARPGGWPIIGKTPLTLVDVDDDYFPIAVGHVIRFRSITESEFGAAMGGRL